MLQVRTTTPRLTQRQIRFLDEYAKTRNGTEAAKSVGYSRSSAPQMAKRTLQNPKAQEYLLALQAESRAITAYDLATAMKESLEVIAYAKAQGNAMAYFKAVEHRAKLSGLLVERIHLEKVDLSGALEAARARVVNLPALSIPDHTPSRQHEADTPHTKPA